MSAPGTAQLHERTEKIWSEICKVSTRQRAMLLSWVDDYERALGYGMPGEPPRTAQIRQYWRDQGEPDLGG